MTTITVVVPTITGREDHYARCIEAYQTRSHFDLNLVTVKDLPTCGEAWNRGAAVGAPGDYLHFSADDLEPHQGWDIAAMEVVDAGQLPAPRIVNPAGELDYCGDHGVDHPDGVQVQMSVIPFMSWAMWGRIGPSLNTHYFTDNYLSWRGYRAGYPTVVKRAYAFTHHWAQPGRGAGMTVAERMAHDRQVFHQAMLPSSAVP